MGEDFEATQGKTAGDLGREALWYAIYTTFAVVILLLVVLLFWASHPDPEALSPKLWCTLCALLVPMAVGFFVARARGDQTAQYVWISGLLTFAIVCVWVLDLPTGNGLCESCAHAPVRKLTRTFFEINNGSGLMGGDGLLIGTWVPLSMIGYALGARFGLRSHH